MLLQRDKIVSDESRFAPSERSGARQKGIAPRGDPKLKPWRSSIQRPKAKYRDLSTAQRTIRPSVATDEMTFVLGRVGENRQQQGQNGDLRDSSDTAYSDFLTVFLAAFFAAAGAGGFAFGFAEDFPDRSAAQFISGCDLSASS